MKLGSSVKFTCEFNILSDGLEFKEFTLKFKDSTEFLCELFKLICNLEGF